MPNISKETFDALPEDVQTNFEQDGDGYRVKAPSELKAAFDSNKEKLSSYKALGDLDQIKAWKAAHDDAEAKALENEKDAAELRKKFKKDMDERDEQVRALTAQIQQRDISDVANRAMDEAGVTAKSRGLVGRDLMAQMKVEDGKVVMRGDVATPNKYLEAMKKEQSYLFETERKGGSGATPPVTQPNGGGFQPVTPAEFRKMDTIAQQKYLKERAAA